MKKKLQKKLSFSKNTICNLDEQMMDQTKGGTKTYTYFVGCVTYTINPVTCACGGETYETCAAAMCETEYPFPC